VIWWNADYHNYHKKSLRDVLHAGFSIVASVEYLKKSQIFLLFMRRFIFVRFHRRRKLL